MQLALASAGRRWSDFFHAECDTRVLALLRIGFATLVLIQCGAVAGDVEMLWSDGGMLPLRDLHAVAGGFVPTLFEILPRTNAIVWMGYGFLVFHAALLLVGYRSRVQLIAVLVWLVSFQNRNPLLVNGQDAVLRLIGFFLAFAPIGASFSIDRRRSGGRKPRAPQFPLRFVQIQIAVVMLAAGIWKLRGDDWTSGVALYYVTRLDGLWGNLPLPAVLQSSEVAVRFATFGTLGLELSVPIAIWITPLRRPALAVALLFHASLTYAMNLFLFGPIMLLGWCSFLTREDLDWVTRAVSRPLQWPQGEAT
jgi:hypothetical protein